jgi:hypothetical protein
MEVHVRRAFCLCSLVVFAACGGGSTIVDVASFDQSCKVATDCAPVVEGSVCDCPCPNAAINVADYASYDRAEQAALTHCPGVQPECGVCSPPIGVLCQQGKCVVH